MSSRPQVRAGVLLALGLLVAGLVAQSSSTTRRRTPARSRSAMLFRSELDGRIAAWSTNGGAVWLEECPPAWRRRGPR